MGLHSSLVLMAMVGAALVEGKGSGYTLERRMWGPDGPWGFQLELGESHVFCEKLPEWLKSLEKGGDGTRRAFLRFGDQVTICDKEDKKLKENIAVPALSRDLLYLQIALLLLFHCLSPGWSTFFPQLYFSLALTGAMVANGWKAVLWVGAAVAGCSLVNARVTWCCLTLGVMTLYAFFSCPSSRFLAGYLAPYLPVGAMDWACLTVSSWFCSDPPMGQAPFLDWIATWWKSAAMSVAYPMVYAHVVGLFHRKWVAILGYSLATLLGAYGRTDDQSFVMVFLILMVVYQWVAGLCAEVPEEVPPPPRPIFPEGGPTVTPADTPCAPAKATPAPRASRGGAKHGPGLEPAVPEREEPISVLKGAAPPPSALRRESSRGSTARYQASEPPRPMTIPNISPSPAAPAAPAARPAAFHRGALPDSEEGAPAAPSRKGVKRPRDESGDGDPRSKKSKTD